MKLNIELARKNRERAVNGAINRTLRASQPEALAEASIPEHFRRLKWNEVVRHGDFIADERLGLKPWEGPGGFHASTFLKPIFRMKKARRFRTCPNRK